MSISNPNVPKSILAIRSYTAQTFLHDLLAGITVGLVALPLAMAFGIASGVTPQAGLYTAVVAGFLISALGGSRTQIGGTDRSIRSDRGGHRGALRHERPGAGDANGRNHSGGDGAYRTGRGSAIHSADGGHRVYQRNRSPDCFHANQGLLRASHWSSAQRVSAANEGSCRTFWRLELVCAGAGAGCIGPYGDTATLHQARAGVDRRGTGMYGGGGVLSFAGGDDRHTLRRYSARLSAFCDSRFSC